MRTTPWWKALYLLPILTVILMASSFLWPSAGVGVSSSGYISFEVSQNPAQPGSELVNLRTRNSKTFATETGFALDATIGAVHYDDGGIWQDIDTALVPAEAPWDWKMEEAGYQAYFVEQFLSDMIVRFEKAGEWIEFQPEALQWWNDWEDVQVISMPTEVTGLISGNIIHWADAYGPGLDFQWETQNTRLAKLLIIDDWASLPSPEPYMLEGPNLVLDLNINFAFSSGVAAYIMDEVWDESTQQFHDFVEFRDISTGEVLWAFMPLRAWGSGDTLEGETTLDLKLNTTGGGPSKKLYLHVVTPYDWLEAVTYPIYIDATVDEQVGASTDDCYRRLTPSDWDLTYNYFRAGAFNSSYKQMGGGGRFQTVAIDNGATVDVAYLTLTARADGVGTTMRTRISGEDVDDAATFADDSAAFDTRWANRTSARVDWDGLPSWVLNEEYESPSIVTVIKEIVDRPGWATGQDMVLFWDDFGDRTTDDSGAPERKGNAYDGNAAKAPWLHVEWSSGAVPDISNTPSTWGAGTVATSATPATGLDHFAVTNNSGFAVDIALSGTDMTGGTAWDLSDTGTAGADIVGLKAGLDGGSYNIIIKETAPYNDLVTSLADSGTQDWGMQMFVPTSFSDGNLKTGTVTLTATAS